MRTAFKTILLASVCFAPISAFAQNTGGFDVDIAPQQSAAATEVPPLFNNEVGVTLLGVSGTNTDQYGRYNGFTTKGVDVLAEFSAQGAKSWDSGDANYWNVTGVNLNFQTGNGLAGGFTDAGYTNGTSNNLAPTGSVVLNVGDQGTWGFKAYWDALSYTGNIIDTLYTMDGNVGVLNGGLAPSGGATNSLTAPYGTEGSLNSGTPGSSSCKISSVCETVAGLAPYMQQVQVGTRRDVVGGEGNYEVDNWTFDASIRHEHKEGTMEESIYESYGGQAFAMPINYDTDRYDVSAAYNVEDFQAVLQYTYSHFSDNNASVIMPYPLSATSEPYARTGVYAEPPSTDAHYVTAMVGYNPTPSTRVNFNLRLGMELQDAGFVPNTGDANISGSNFAGFANLNSQLEGTSSGSLNASAKIYQGGFSITSKLFEDVDGRFFASFDGRSVSLDQSKVWIGGSSFDSSATTAVYVVPQDWQKEKFGGELTYRILPENDTKLSVGYEYDDIHRTNAQVDDSDTNIVSVNLTSRLGSQLSGRLSYVYTDRSGSLDYDRPWANLDGSPSLGDAASGAYYQAPMTSSAVKFAADYTPFGNLSGGVYVQYGDEDYHYPNAPLGVNLIDQIEGIKQDSKLSVGPDIDVRPATNVNVHLFYTYEQIFFDNLGNGACANSDTAGCLGSAGYFKNDYTSNTNTIGTNLEWKVSDKLKFNTEYTFSSGSVAFSEYNGVWISSTPTQPYQNVVNYPDIDSTLHSLRLSAEYQITESMELSAAYSFNMYRSDDWNDAASAVQQSTTTGTGATAIAVLTPGYSSPNYNVSTFGIGFKVKF